MLLVSLENIGGFFKFYSEDGAAIRKLAPRATYIQADGDELERIRRTFTVLADGVGLVTIPIPRRAVAGWFGDIAKTIMCNW